MFRPIPHAKLIPCSLGVAYSGESGQAWCAKWFPCAMHEKIAAGFSDGENCLALKINRFEEVSSTVPTPVAI